MKQVVVTTERDEIVAEARVVETGLLEFLAPWIVRPEHLIYIDGELMSDEQRETLVHLIKKLMAEQAQPSTPAPASTTRAVPGASPADTASLELIRQPERLTYFRSLGCFCLLTLRKQLISPQLGLRSQL